jgi:G:T-mismatch repair DNA endonuclease (very short patch repair protein)
MSCSYQDRNHEQAKARRIQTCLDRYGTPVPPVPPTSYGKTENVISGWLREINFEPKAQHQLSNGKSIDIVLPNEKLAIEYCGLYWHHEHSPTPRLRLYHYDKMRLAQEEGWQLITVFEDEWKLHENGVKSLILARLEKPQRRLFARECQIEALSSEVTKTFLDQFHIQGPPHAFLFSTGIYQNQQLLGVLTLSEHHRQNYATTLVLSRMAFLPSVQIVGGAGRLLKHALRMLGSTTHTRLVSWSDNRYSNGDVYRALGFSLQAELPPDYQYVIIQKPRERISKQSQRKTKSKCPAGMTELQWAEQRGLARIWDCGKKRWELTLPIP